MFEYKGIKIIWLGHDGFLIKGKKTICIDPFKIERQDKADILLISHEHYDHLNIDDIKKVVTPETTVVASKQSIPQLSKLKVKSLKSIIPGQEEIVEGINIRAIPAYNVNKFQSPGRPFHPKQDEKVGYVVTMDGVKIYHTGDSDFIPEMKDLKPDIALLPVSGTYVMTAEEAVEAVKAIKPKVAIPMHYASIVGRWEDAWTFKKLAPCKVEVLDKNT